VVAPIANIFVVHLAGSRKAKLADLGPAKKRQIGRPPALIPCLFASPCPQEIFSAKRGIYDTAAFPGLVEQNRRASAAEGAIPPDSALRRYRDRFYADGLV